MSFSRKAIAEAKRTLREAVKDRLSTGGPEDALNFCLDVASRAGESDEADLMAFLASVQALSLSHRYGGLKDTHVERLTDLAHTLLHRHKVHPETSELSFLFSDLHLARSQIRFGQGRLFQAIGEEALAEQLSRRGNARRTQLNLLARAVRLLRLGHVTEAAELFLASENHGPRLSGESFELARLGRIKCLRLSGQGKAARKMIGTTKSFVLSHEARLELTWEEACLEATRTRASRPVLALVRASSPHHVTTYVLEACLWGRADPTRETASQIPACRTIRNKFGPDVRRGASDGDLFACVSALEECHDLEIPLWRRIQKLTDALETSAVALAKDHHMLFLLAATRWAHRANQGPLAAMLHAEAKALSSRFSSGRKADVLGMGEGLEGRLSLLATKRVAQKKVRTSLTGRMAVLGKLSAGAATTYASGRIRAAGLPSEERAELYADEVVAMARLARESLGALKGPLMKLGQTLSYVESSLPPAAKAELAGLLNDAQPVDSQEVERVVREELGADPRKIFAEWDEEPLATASMGQVHRARTRDGMEVVVKVQFPGMDQIIRNDLRTLALAKPVMRRLFPSADPDAHIKELTDRFLEECDYRIECENQREFGEILADDPDVVVPAVVTELSGRRVLTSELRRGRTFEEFCASATQEERNRAGAALYRMTFCTMFRHRIFHADPHPGNLLFEPGGRVVMFDYGCVKRWSPEFMGHWKDLIRSTLERDFERNRKAWDALGYVVDKDRFDYGEQFRFYAKIILPMYLLSGERRFAREGLGALFTTKEFLANPNAPFGDIPADHVFALRLSFGTAALLSRLEPICNWREIGLSFLYDSKDQWPEPPSAAELADILGGGSAA